MMIETFKRWRGFISNVVTVVILGLVIYWGWQNRTLVIQVIADLGYVYMAVAILWIMAVTFFSLMAFTLLVRGFGYRFSLRDGYVCLYLSQITAMLPGAVWGYVGLGGLLWAHGISKRDSALIILFNIVQSLAACALVSMGAFATEFGSVFALMGIVPLVLLFFFHAPIDRLRTRYFSWIVLSILRMAQIVTLYFIVWLIEAGCFVWLFNCTFKGTSISPWFVAGAYTIGYLAGFVSVFAPSGIGVREGVIVLLLGQVVEANQVLAVAITFRLVQSLVQWMNILGAMLLRSRTVVIGER